MFTLSHHVTLLTSLAALVLALPPATVTAGAAGTNQVVATGGLYEVHILLTADIDDPLVFVRPWSYRRITELEAEVKALRAEVEELKRTKPPAVTLPRVEDGVYIIPTYPNGQDGYFHYHSKPEPHHDEVPQWGIQTINTNITWETP